MSAARRMQCSPAVPTGREDSARRIADREGGSLIVPTLVCLDDLQVAGRNGPLRSPSPSVTPPGTAPRRRPCDSTGECGDRRAHAKTEGLRLMNATPIRDDEQLIELFLVGAPDEAESAFKRLVKRHRPAVMSLPTGPRTGDARDAVRWRSQLVQNAGRIRNRRVLGAWLRRGLSRRDPDEAPIRPAPAAPWRAGRVSPRRPRIYRLPSCGRSSVVSPSPSGGTIARRGALLEGRSTRKWPGFSIARSVLSGSPVAVPEDAAGAAAPQGQAVGYSPDPEIKPIACQCDGSGIYQRSRMMPDRAVTVARAAARHP